MAATRNDLHVSALAVDALDLGAASRQARAQPKD
jgi:hypothetical protein